MAKNFRPNYPFSTPMELQIPAYTQSKGVEKKTFTTSQTPFFASFKAYTGTETVTNDLYTVVDTAIVETWFRPDIKADCRIKVLPTGKVYEILGAPENIDLRNQFLKFRVRAVEGGA